MVKKIFIILSLVIISLIAWKIFSLKKMNLAKNDQAKNTNVLSEESAPPPTNKEYLDESGFKITYPNNLVMTKTDIIDENIYSELELTSEEKTGKIEIKIEASDIADIEDWLTINKIKPEKKDQIKLSDIEATQFIIDNKIETIAFDQGIEISIVTDLKENKEYWTKINQQIISSFSFVDPKTVENPTSTNDNSNNDVVFEGEEIIE